MSKSSSSTRLNMKGSLHIPNFVASSLRTRGAMVNGALSPHRVPESPYYNCSCSRKVRAPSFVHRIVFYPVNITGERADEPGGQGRRIVRRTLCTYIFQPFYLCWAWSSRMAGRRYSTRCKILWHIPFGHSRQFSNAHLGKLWLFLNRDVERW